jgi:predicted DNA-binding transcriptional regulator AlpA
MTSREVEKAIGLAPYVIDIWRCKNRPGQPPYTKVGRRVVYWQDDIEAWLEANTVRQVA